MKIDTTGRRFAVIVNEAHSSQSGETATVLKGMLNQAAIAAARLSIAPSLAFAPKPVLAPTVSMGNIPE